MEIAVLALWACLVALHAHGNQEVNYIEVETGLGRLKGYRENVHGVDVDVFLGVPFAKPPIGELRFQRTRSASSWQGVYDATHRPASCYQSIDTAFQRFRGVDMWNANTNMSEDCLYLNIWAPSTRTYGAKSFRAVMVWIYGGGFYGGTSTLDLYDGRLFAATNDIIVVSMQYRVGALGFMYLGHASAPGNVGLVDQQLALQWIYNHIADFGGDKHQVTLFGESAGAVSVSLHLVSPLTQKLFKYAIMQSGSALCRWGVESKTRAKERSLALAERVGCKEVGVDKPVNEIIACMQDGDPTEITDKMWTLQDDYNLITPILTTIDDYYLREHPSSSVKRGKFKRTNILLGSNKDEGSYFLVYGIPKLFFMRQNQTLEREEYLSVIEAMARSNENTLADAVDFEYAVPQEFGHKARYRDILDDVVGDSEFICPVVDFGYNYALHNNPVYMYQFIHTTTGNPWPRWMGVMHGYEIDHVFGLPLNGTYNYTNSEKQLSRRMMEYWTNFAKTGSPSRTESEWLPYTSDEKHYMVLDTNRPVMKQGLRDRQCKFWGSYMPKLKEAFDRAEAASKQAKCSGMHMNYSLPSVLLALVLAAILA